MMAGMSGVSNDVVTAVMGCRCELTGFEDILNANEIQMRYWVIRQSNQLFGLHLIPVQLWEFDTLIQLVGGDYDADFRQVQTIAGHKRCDGSFLSRCLTFTNREA